MKNLLRFLFELGHLKCVPRSGWTLLGVQTPESVSEHSLRAAQIAFFIALGEKREPFRAVTMVVFHDMVETRSGDRHKLAQRYVTVDEIRIAQDQCAPLEELGASVLDLWKEREENQTPDAIIANDADLVDVAVQAKEYLDFGHLSAMEWIDYAKAKVQTATAKKLLAELLKVRLTDWWQGLKKL